MQQLKDKIIFVTGASDGIGNACAKAYAAEGAYVVVVSNHEERIKQVVTELGDGHLGIFCDVANESQVKAAIEKTLDSYGRIDCIHNNAGITSPSKALHETSNEELELLMNVNIKGVYHTTKHGLEALKKTKGCILNTSSLVAEIGQEIHAVYAATKGAVNALTKSMALDYAKYGIRVNAVSPAAVKTPALEKWCSEQPNALAIENSLATMHPLGYCPEPDVVADACVFLLSDKARFITGCILPVSGAAELGYRR